MAKPQIIQQGAEAIISLNKDNQILKDRTKKSYRLPELDNKIRKSRTKSEAKLLEKTSKLISVPKIIETDNKEKIIMQYINGKKLSDNLEKLDYKKICKQIGEILTKLHNQDIIHGDLTTSNMIYVENKDSISSKKPISLKKQSYKDEKIKDKQVINNKISDNKKENKNFKIYLIDFGLGFYSKKIEDKAVDLHLLKQALEAKHFSIAKQCITTILKNYKANNYKLIINRIHVIESRGRYKGKTNNAQKKYIKSKRNQVRTS